MKFKVKLRVRVNTPEDLVGKLFTHTGHKAMWQYTRISEDRIYYQYVRDARGAIVEGFVEQENDKDNELAEYYEYIKRGVWKEIIN